MAFQQPSTCRPASALVNTAQSSDNLHRIQTQQTSQLQESQEWVLFSPSHAGESSTDRTAPTQTAGLSRASDLGSLITAERSGRLGSSVLEEELTEDAELDSLDDGLHAFQQPTLFQATSNQVHGPLLPTHDGLGTFPASSAPVLEQLWQHEQYNPKRKHEGRHRRPSSVLRTLDTIEELEAQANEEKRIRIEKWRLEQSQVLMQEVERETRRRVRRESDRQQAVTSVLEDKLGTTPKQQDFLPMQREKGQTAGKLDQDPEPENEPENEPFWRRVTRKFIRDVIGIDEPLLSVILGESLPGESTPRAPSPALQAAITESEQDHEVEDSSWRDRLLQRIAKELGVFVHQLTPHPGAFTSHDLQHQADYAGMPVSAIPARQVEREIAQESFATDMSPNFPPTLRDPAHAESWGFEEEPVSSLADSSINLKREREYWERELDIKMLFRFLKDRFAGNEVPPTDPKATSQSLQQQLQTQRQQRQRGSTFEDTARRTAVIRQHHPLVARAHRPTVRTRRDSRLSAVKRPSSSCASESVKSSRNASALKSGSSRNYWDIGGSVGSGSILASGGYMGAWGEV